MTRGDTMRNRTRRRPPRSNLVVLLLALAVSIASRADHGGRPAIAAIFASAQSPVESTNCWVPCSDTPDSNVAVPRTNCKQFYVCRGGRVTNTLACSAANSFDARIGACNYAYLVTCADPTCAPTGRPTVRPTGDPTNPPTISPSGSPTESPTVSPTASPTKRPTVSPTVSPTDSPTTSPTVSPTTSPTVFPTEFPSDPPSASPTAKPSIAMEIIESKQGLVEQYVLRSFVPDAGTAYPSIRYSFDDFRRALRVMAVDGFGADFRFMLWDTDEDRFRHGLVNVAAFLAQATAEAIGDDTCDELNWQQVAGRYAISNSCGQEGRSYQDETCGIFSCAVDPGMEVTAVSSANRVRAPPPMECRPGSGSDSYAGYWNTNSGTEIRNTPYSNTAGRIDVEGCCYWGRGVLLTRGSCNIGKLNYYLGARAAREGRRSLYPNIDFCADPEATCASSATKELRWTTAMFEWSERVQRYNDAGWAYEDELIRFFDDGMVDDSFIDSVGRIFSRGCHADGCSDLEVRGADERKSTFYLIVNDILGIDSIKLPTSRPTNRPTRRPTKRPTKGPTRRPNPEPTPRPTPRPTNRATPRPTPRPTNRATPRPTPQPSNPPVPVDQSPQGPANPYNTPRPTPRPLYPPVLVDQSPTFATPRPIGIVPIGRPSNGVSDGQEVETFIPTFIPTAETIIVLEGNGAESEEALVRWCSYAIFGVSTAYFLLATA